MFYPVTLGKYFLFALQRRKDVEIYSVGPYTGTFIPWKGGIHLPDKYSAPPDLPLSSQLCGQLHLSPKIVEHQLPWEPDLWINVDAGFGFSKPECPYAVIATDPHVHSHYTAYREQIKHSSDMRFYNMQYYYMKEGDKYLPYAADPIWHAPLEREKEYDVCLIGLQYENRTTLVNRLRSRGLKVYYDTGPCYAEYQELYAKSRIAFSWSSKKDLIARVFEGMAMQIPVVCNRVPDMPTHFVDGEHYYGFGDFNRGGDPWTKHDVDEAEAQIHLALANYDDASQVASNAHNKIFAQHLYDFRISQIFDDFGLT